MDLLTPGPAAAIRTALHPRSTLVGYSLLAGGALTGKYLDGVPERSRRAVSREAGSGWRTDARQAKAVRKLLDLAERRGLAPSTLVAVHALRSSPCDVVLAGASEVGQVDALADALGLVSDASIMVDAGGLGFGDPG